MRFLFVDRILELIEGKLIRGIKHMTSEDQFIDVQPGLPPFFISSLLGETLGQLAAWNVMKTKDFKSRPVAGITSCATVYRPAFIGETIALESVIDHLDDAAVEYHSTAHVGAELIFSLEGALGPMLPMDTFIDESTVRLQFEQIYRPGTWPPPPSLPSLTELIVTPTTSPSMSSFQFDRILDIEPAQSIHAEKRINFAAPYFPDHFPKRPVLPLTVLLECLHHLAKTFFEASNIKGYRLYQLKRIKMKDFVQPGDIISSSLSMKEYTAEQLTLQAQTLLEGKRICALEMIFIQETSCN
jgi:3-hydroxymyristoyl/3-hydroxydecanoyl-(acyl carrier protein) dehydratase